MDNEYSQNGRLSSAVKDAMVKGGKKKETDDRNSPDSKRVNNKSHNPNWRGRWRYEYAVSKKNMIEPPSEVRRAKGGGWGKGTRSAINCEALRRGEESWIKVKKREDNLGSVGVNNL